MRWRRIISICITHACLSENKAVFVLYHAFTLCFLFFSLPLSVCRIVDKFLIVFPQCMVKKWVMDREIKSVARRKWRGWFSLRFRFCPPAVFQLLCAYHYKIKSTWSFWKWMMAPTVSHFHLSCHSPLPHDEVNKSEPSQFQHLVITTYLYI